MIKTELGKFMSHEQFFKNMSIALFSNETDFNLVTWNSKDYYDVTACNSECHRLLFLHMKITFFLMLQVFIA